MTDGLAPRDSFAIVMDKLKQDPMVIDEEALETIAATPGRFFETSQRVAREIGFPKIVSLIRQTDSVGAAFVRSLSSRFEYCAPLCANGALPELAAKLQDDLCKRSLREVITALVHLMYTRTHANDMVRNHGVFDNIVEFASHTDSSETLKLCMWAIRRIAEVANTRRMYEHTEFILETLFFAETRIATLASTTLICFMKHRADFKERMRFFGLQSHALDMMDEPATMSNGSALFGTLWHMSYEARAIKLNLIARTERALLHIEPDDEQEMCLRMAIRVAADSMTIATAWAEGRLAEQLVAHLVFPLTGPRLWQRAKLMTILMPLMPVQKLVAANEAGFAMSIAQKFMHESASDDLLKVLLVQIVLRSQTERAGGFLSPRVRFCLKTPLIEDTSKIREELLFARIAEIGIGLESLHLPALVTLKIINAGFQNALPMYRKWNRIVAIKHFDRVAVKK